MPRITIAGIGRTVDGEYEIDFEDTLSYGELDLIYRISDVLPPGIIPGLIGGNAALVVAITKVALDRNGKDVSVETLMGAKAGALLIEATEKEKASEEEEESLPPASAPQGASETASASGSSGASTSNGSADSQETTLASTGHLH